MVRHPPPGRRYLERVLVLIAAVALGGVIGVCRAPAGVHTARPRLHHIWVFGIGGIFYALSLLLNSDLAPLALAASFAAFIAAAMANRHLTGAVLVGLGLLLNLTALVLNNGVAVRQSALEQATGTTAGQEADLAGAQHLESRRDTFGALGAVVPIRPTQNVLSFGDLIVILGAAEATRELTRRRRRRWSQAERDTYRDCINMIRTVQDWGTAPKALPLSGSQYSAKPDATAPVVIDLTNDRDTSDRPPLVAASHSR